MYSKNRPACNTYNPSKSYDRDHHKTETYNWQGHEETVTRFKDGSSIRHGGGPCGDMHYDEHGEEC